MVHQPEVLYCRDAEVVYDPVKRRKARHRLSRNLSQVPDAEWTPFQTVKEWRDHSPTYRAFVETRQSLKTALLQAQRTSNDAKDRLIETLRVQLSIARANLGTVAKRQPAAKLEHKADTTSDLSRVLQQLGSPQDSQHFAAGALTYGLLLFVCGAAPWSLPYVFLAFVAVCLPWRIWDFHKKQGDFFLLDFCYWANYGTAAFLVLAPQNAQLQAAVSALADGPLSGALVVWQCAWVFGSASHCISVMMHLLPGLALYAHKHFSLPPEVMQLSQRLGLGSSAAATPSSQRGDRMQSHPGLLWLVLAPMLFYAMWQLVYWFVVQVCSNKFIKQHHYQTSYSVLAKRAAKTNNVWNRLVRRGRPARRICMFGLIQLVFTIGCLLLFIPVYNSFILSTVWQVAKFVFPVYYGSRYQCEKVPKHAMMKALKHCSLQVTTEAISVTAFATTASAVKVSGAAKPQKSS